MTRLFFIILIINIISFGVIDIIPKNSKKESNNSSSHTQIETIYKLKYISSEDAIKNIKLNGVTINAINDYLIIQSSKNSAMKVLKILEKVDVLQKQINITLNAVQISKSLSEKLGASLERQDDNGLNEMFSNGFISILKFFQLNTISFNFDELKQNQDLKVNTSVNIKVLDNHKATFYLTEDLRIIGENNKNSQTDSAGIIISITPKIVLKNGIEKIKFSIEYENSKFISNSSKTKNKIQTTIISNNNRYVYIGGLDEEYVKKSEKTTPFLSDIPLIGDLFTKVEDMNYKKQIYIELYGNIEDEE